MECVVLLWCDSCFEHVTFVRHQLDCDHTGVFVGTGIETKYIFTLVKGKGCFECFIDIEIFCMPDQCVAKLFVRNAVYGSGDLYFLAIRVSGVRFEAVFIGRFGEIHSDFHPKAAFGEKIRQLCSGLEFLLGIMFVYECGTTKDDQITTTVQKVLRKTGGSCDTVLSATYNDGIILLECPGGFFKRHDLHLIAVLLECVNNDAVIVVMKGANERTFRHNDVLLCIFVDSYDWLIDRGITVCLQIHPEC